MSINLEVPKKFVPLLTMAHTVADEVFLPISLGWLVLTAGALVLFDWLPK